MALPVVQVPVSLNVPSRVDIVGAESVRAAAAMAALLKDKHNRGVEKDVLEEDSAADEEEGEKVDNERVEGSKLNFYTLLHNSRIRYFPWSSLEYLNKINQRYF